MTELRYRPATDIDELQPGECCIRGWSDRSSARGWHLWWVGIREDNGKQELFAVPVIPRGPFTENGPGGRRSWGLAQVAPDRWQISPSIDVLSDADARRFSAGQPRQEPSIWHQTPAIVGVPSGEPWQ